MKICAALKSNVALLGSLLPFQRFRPRKTPLKRTKERLPQDLQTNADPRSHLASLFAKSAVRIAMAHFTDSRNEPGLVSPNEPNREQQSEVKGSPVPYDTIEMCSQPETPQLSLFGEESL